MGNTLKVSTDDLHTAGTGLRTVATEFEGLERLMEDYDHTMGHKILAEKLHDFQDSWNDTREKMIESIKGLADTAKKAGETYEQVDTQLTDVLLGKGGGK